MNVSQEDFEEMIRNILKNIPEKFKEHIDNVEFLLMDKPTINMLIKSRIYGKGSLLGLYEGIPLNKRGRNYQGVLPDRITLFKYPIIIEAEREGINIKEKVRSVLLHEIGHYFGLSEKELRDLGIF
jgi:predicted Zn-dependent protease with MMP-like domain